MEHSHRAQPESASSVHRCRTHVGPEYLPTGPPVCACVSALAHTVYACVVHACVWVYVWVHLQAYAHACALIRAHPRLHPCLKGLCFMPNLVHMQQCLPGTCSQSCLILALLCPSFRGMLLVSVSPCDCMPALHAPPVIACMPALCLPPVIACTPAICFPPVIACTPARRRLDRHWGFPSPWCCSLS